MEKRIIRRSADFASDESFRAHTVTVSAESESLPYAGLPLDYLGNGRYAVTKDEQHALIIGDTGCGKTRRLIIPAVRLLSLTGESMVISDPKGELYQKNAAVLAERGYEIRVLNLREPRNGDRWNPLERIERLYRSDDEDERDRALMMLDEIIDMMGESVKSDDDRFWENVSKQLIRSCALTILEYGDEGDLTFENLSLVCSAVTEDVSKRIKVSDEDGTATYESSFQSFYSSLPSTSEIRQSFMSSVCSTSDRTFSSIATVTHTMVNLYTRQSSLRHLFSASDFDISSLGEKKTALFIILPDEMETLYPMATLFVSQIYSVLIDRAYGNGGKLKRRVNFILDEFANFSRLRNISSMLTASRSRGMRFFLVCQDTDQLDSVYSKAGAAVIRSNCQSWVFMGCRNAEFLTLLSRLGGTYHEAYTGKDVPLITESDLQTLETGEAFVWVKGIGPRYVTLPDYSSVDWKAEEGGRNFPPRNTSPRPRQVDPDELFRRGAEGEDGKKRKEMEEENEMDRRSQILYVIETNIERLSESEMNALEIALLDVFRKSSASSSFSFLESLSLEASLRTLLSIDEEKSGIAAEAMDIFSAISLPSWKEKKKEEKVEMLKKIMELKNSGYLTPETADRISAFALGVGNKED